MKEVTMLDMLSILRLRKNIWIQNKKIEKIHMEISIMKNLLSMNGKKIFRIKKKVMISFLNSSIQKKLSL